MIFWHPGAINFGQIPLQFLLHILSILLGNQVISCNYIINYFFSKMILHQWKKSIFKKLKDRLRKTKMNYILFPEQNIKIITVKVYINFIGNLTLISVLLLSMDFGSDFIFPIKILFLFFFFLNHFLFVSFLDCS